MCVANFAAVPHEGYQLALPQPGTWDEVVNTDATAYTGSGVGNLGAVEATAAGATIVVPPLATVYFRHRP